MASVTLELSIQNFCKLNADANDYRQNRSQVIHLIAGHYDETHYPASGLSRKYFEKGLCDGFLQKAEDVALRNSFSDFPGPRGRLTPLATSYLEGWHNVLLDHAASLNSRVENFVLAHKAFSHQYIEELKECGRGSDIGVALNFPATLKYFYSCVGLYLAEHPRHCALFQEQLECVDQELLLSVSNIVILNLLKYPHCAVPELLGTFKIHELLPLYQALSIEERSNIEEGLFDKETVLSPEAKELLSKLKEIYWRLNEKNLALDFSSCFRVLAEELKEDFALANDLKKELKDVDPNEIEPSISGVLYGLLHLSKDSLGRLYSFLPTLVEIGPFKEKFKPELKSSIRAFLYEGTEITDDKDFEKIVSVRCDLRQEQKLYRLLGIFQQLFNK